MTTDLRHLLAIYVHAHRTGNSVPPHIDAEARWQLGLPVTDGPAVPKGREPASVISEPTQRQLMMLAYEMNLPSVGEAANYARAVLARWGNPAPQPPGDGEVAELVQLLGSMAAEAELADQVHDASVLDRAADLLQRLSPPQPVPVSERLPVAEDCDAEGRCWVWWKNGVRWVLDEWTHHELREGRLSDCVTHWLPAHALPLPEVSQ